MINNKDKVGLSLQVETEEYLRNLPEIDKNNLIRVYPET